MKSAACLCLCAFFLCAAETAKEVFDGAVRALAAGDYETAERGFQSVLREQPRQIAALSNLGVIYSRTNRADKAIAVYQRALRVSPNDKTILLNLGLVYLRQEAHARALPLFARVVAIDPQHLQARQLLAVCRAYVGQLAPAILDLEALHTAAPRDEGILFLLGFAYLKNHDAEKAKAIFQLMFEAAGAERAQFLLGKPSYEATLFAQAEESFFEVLRLDPRFPGVYLEIGEGLHQPAPDRRRDPGTGTGAERKPRRRGCELFPGRSAGPSRALRGSDSLPRAGEKGEARLLGALLLFGEGQTPAGATGGGRRTAPESRGVEPRRGVSLQPAWAGAPGLRTRSGSQPGAPPGPRVESCRARGYPARRWKGSGRPLRSDHTAGRQRPAASLCGR